MAASSKQVVKGSSKTAARNASASGPASWPSRASSYIDEIKREMRLVTWPSREQVRSTTVVVIATVAFFGVFFGVVDYLLAIGQTELYRAFSR